MRSEAFFVISWMIRQNTCMTHDENDHALRQSHHDGREDLVEQTWQDTVTLLEHGIDGLLR